MRKNNKLKILITGANGQLGQEIVQLGDRLMVEISGFGRERLDITNLAQCQAVIADYMPDAVIHCAAYTAVDKAESEPEEAFRINAEGTRNVALASKAIGAKLCYVSTDYVFDGCASTPYQEQDPVNPLTVYGDSKLAGESEVRSIIMEHFIVRTSWVFGKYGKNFVKTIRKLAKEKDRLQVVNDQFGSPTYTLDLANFLLQLIQTEHYGIYHASNSGACSWYEFAQAILQECGLNQVRLEPCSTAEFPRPATRPAFSVMDHAAIRRYGFAEFRPWQEALKHLLETKKVQ
ncbi:dTDP-4-dehydrorhamnose reductase [Paenibacillus lycopersici]|uniref:dTDP-4-dehydrorhamnose reductase n=1 Tax=Paenibacillus lycopersici TaxID=2704462 RepID=A0A6C0FTC8_9BACL|nr:dTDP-4-dehydrorhamnose reductase [Paenibacillus lycopersici]QHT59272.1 dTDP-4-dehydrorhamnose reductase [Paenibacillus lycopersici]